MPSSNSTSLLHETRNWLQSQANPKNAREMAAYMKTEMPFYGVQKKKRIQLNAILKKSFVPTSKEEYEENILALWNEPHREEKYTAIEYAQWWPQFIHMNSLALFETLVREGGWWDLVDGVATRLVSPVLRNHRATVRGILDQWVRDDDLWIRRAALLAHMHHKEKTDHRRLFRDCRMLAPEKEFFIRKALGWILRHYSESSPERVKSFLERNQTRLSGLSFREGSKHLKKAGIFE
jgi:3-methyladenine DNA glycosylase AlkD